MNKKDITDELNTISADLILKQDDPFTAGTISRGVTEIETLRARVLELEARNAGLVEAIEDAAERIRNRRSKAEAAEARVAELEARVEPLQPFKKKILDLEATIARLEGLLPGWKEGDFDLPDYTRGKMDGRHECVKQLKSVLDKAGN